MLNLASRNITDVLEEVLQKYSLARDGLYHYIRSLALFDDPRKEPDIQGQVKMEVQWPGIESRSRGRCGRATVTSIEGLT